MLYIILFITVVILVLLAITLLIIRSKKPKAFNSILIWIIDSLPEYILDALTFIAMGFIMYVWFRYGFK